ncbi:presqualene diphosphate synthase HpnD [Sphingomonas bacterium]|uniref:presqualene diphosphate synthase HpnD n=1 Tax=Sphingomonas bacterium TaxID=1895847 RepID=UPI0015776A6A|nr:presqualene diphosphate synthase HpnD [Sphingomonas bacterium]
MNRKNTPAQLQGTASGSSFYAGMRVLPKAEREAMYAIYAFCRAVDDIADDQHGDRSDRAGQLDAWRADIASLYAGGPPGRAALVAEAVHRFGLLKVDFDAVIDGMAMDVAGDIRWPPAAELDLYCDRVASAVGRLSVRVFGMDEAPGRALAYHLGRALQLTNILRDIDEDAGIGRVYLPLEGLTGAGIALTTPAEVTADPRIDAVARAMAAEADGHYVQARAILARRPHGHLLAPRLMATAYGKVLARMKAVGWQAPRHRVRVSKLGLVWTALRLSLAR